MDRDKLWDLFLVVLGAVLGKLLDEAPGKRKTRKTPDDAGKHFRRS